MLEANKKYWESLNPEERTIRARKWMENKTPEELEDIFLDFSIRMKKYNESLPYEEKLKRVSHMNDYLKSLPKEERKEIARKAHEWIDKMSIEESWEYYKNNLKTMIFHRIKDMTPAENGFINLLSMNGLYNIYVPQYINDIVDKNILKEFPNIRNPFHIWDFRVRLIEEDIYVDIDGSIHAVKPGVYVNDDGKDVGALIQEKERMRKYQTDGLQSYAVLAYNDKIDLSTNVLHINTGKIITVQDLIAKIVVGNMSKRELRKAMKLV